MRIHVVQHAEFEGPGLIAGWADARGHQLSCAFALTEQFPAPDTADLLVILGGPMGASDDAAYPWLTAEKRFIAETIAAGRPVLGICLGSQILAEVLGGSVRRNHESEIGWFEVSLSPEAADEPVLAAWPRTFTVGQWHGDTFEVPERARIVASSDACDNQLFVFGQRTVGMQFHLEWDEAALATLISTCAEDLSSDGAYVMDAQRMRDEAPVRIAACRALLYSLLDALQSVGPRYVAETQV